MSKVAPWPVYMDDEPTRPTWIDSNAALIGTCPIPSTPADRAEGYRLSDLLELELERLCAEYVFSFDGVTPKGKP
jgi:hypothetical protein